MKFEFTKQEVELIKEALNFSIARILSDMTDKKLIMNQNWDSSCLRKHSSMMDLLDKIKKGE